MLSSRIGSTNSTEELIAQMNSVINEIVVELNQNTAKLTERDKRISDLEQKVKVLTVDNKELKKSTGDIFRSQSAKTIKLGITEDSDAIVGIYATSTGALKYKKPSGTIHTIVS